MTPSTESESLTTFAPVIDAPESLHPTGNLLVALPEIDDAGACRSIGVVHEGMRGVLAAVDEDVGLLTPQVVIDGDTVAPDFTWAREADWLPRADATLTGGRLTAQWVAPVSRGGTSDAGVAVRLSYANQGDAAAEVTLRWHGAWTTTAVHHFRPKELALTLVTRDDPWTGTRAVYVGAEQLLLAISWRPGEGATHDGEHDSPTWSISRTATLEPGATLTLDAYLGVASEPDGSGATALHLRRRGFDALHADTLVWLEAHGPRFGNAHKGADAAVAGLQPGASARSAGPGRDLEARVRLNLYFSHFYAQADCLDTGRTVLLTSRSPRYYVSGAFWSRDAYWWSFPALLLTDAARARRVLVESIATAGTNIAHHALYIIGTRLYPGFELDELCAPVLAVWRFVDATGDRSVLDEPAVHDLFALVDRELADVHDASLGLYATMLLPTDDPTEFPFTATNNAFAAVALQIIGRLTGDEPLVERGLDLIRSLAGHFVHEVDGEHRWAWAIDAKGTPEWRDEPPLGLRTLRYWGVIDEADDAAATAMAATERWLVTDYGFHYDGPFPGAGAPHFASPSAFDLGNRILTANTDLGDPVAALVDTPLDNGMACESWDAATGGVVTGAAMASVAGFLAWTAWADTVGHRRWDDPFPLPPHPDQP